MSLLRGCEVSSLDLLRSHLVMVLSSLLWVSGLQSLLITRCSSKTFLGMQL